MAADKVGIKMNFVKYVNIPIDNGIIIKAPLFEQEDMIPNLVEHYKRVVFSQDTPRRITSTCFNYSYSENVKHAIKQFSLTYDNGSKYIRWIREIGYQGKGYKYKVSTNTNSFDFKNGNDYLNDYDYGHAWFFMLGRQRNYPKVGQNRYSLYIIKQKNQINLNTPIIGGHGTVRGARVSYMVSDTRMGLGTFNLHDLIHFNVANYEYSTWVKNADYTENGNSYETRESFVYELFRRGKCLYNDGNYESVDPNAGGGLEEEAGGGGTFEHPDNPIDFPNEDLKSWAIDSNMVTLYTTNTTELQKFANKMFGNEDVLSKVFKHFNGGTIDAILSLKVIPGFPNLSNEDFEVSTIWIANYNTNVMSLRFKKQYEYIRYNDILLSEACKSYLDYSPYTKLMIYLPYIGTRELNADECIGKTIALKYVIDRLTGTCVAMIKAGDKLLYRFEGNTATIIPFTGTQNRDLLSSILNLASSAVVGAIGGPAAGAVALGLDSAGLAIDGMKKQIVHSGNICNGNIGYMLDKIPFIYIEYPNIHNINTYQNFYGYPSYINRALGDIRGYAEIDSIHLEHIPATQNELTEIETLLKKGVLL